MAGQERRGTRGRGRESRREPSWPVVAAVSGAASGSVTGTSPSITAPATLPEQATRSTYRSLLIRGLTPREAANLTAWLCGIQVGAGAWNLDEINRLLFLRELARSGRFGITDGKAARRPH